MDRSSQTRSRLWNWLSTALIVAGVLLLGAGGVMAYLNSVVVAEPPPPIGVIEPAPPPSLEENPLLVVVAEESGPPSLEENPLPVDLGESAALARVKQEPAPVDLGENSAPVLAEEKPYPAAADEGAFGVTGGDKASSASSLPLSAPEPGDPEALRMAGSPPASESPPTRPATGPPIRIVAPAIDLDGEVIPVGWKQVIQGGKTVSVWEVAGYAAGWHRNSALPGEGGNIVLSGHHNIKGEIFRYIVDLNPGDEITLYADGRPYTYTVEARFVVRDKGMSEDKRRENARWIGPFPDERLTLVTCWPYTNNTHRVIVIAKPMG